MSIEMNKTLARRFLEEAWAADPSGIQERSADLLVDGFRYSEDPVVGPTRVSGMGQSLWVELRANRAAFPSLQVEVERVLAEETDVAIWWKATGTHEGAVRLGMGLTDGAEIAATGRTLAARAVTLFGFEGGKIARVRHTWQPLSLLQQLALLEGKMDVAKLLEESAA